LLEAADRFGAGVCVLRCFTSGDALSLTGLLLRGGVFFFNIKINESIVFQQKKKGFLLPRF
jgi:hypothetical protein